MLTITLVTSHLTSCSILDDSDFSKVSGITWLFRHILFWHCTGICWHTWLHHCSWRWGRQAMSLSSRPRTRQSGNFFSAPFLFFVVLFWFRHKLSRLFLKITFFTFSQSCHVTTYLELNHSQRLSSHSKVVCNRIMDQPIYYRMDLLFFKSRLKT